MEATISVPVTRPGLPRVPVLTAAVVTLTAVTSVIGLVSAPFLDALRRDAAALSDGQLWRLLTSMLVQDGGIAGTVTNLVALAVLGAIVERRANRVLWVVAYLGAGLAGQLAGWAGWQPIGAGNSVAVCGLAGVVAVTLLRGRSPARTAAARVVAGPDRADDAAQPGLAAIAVAFWSMALLGSGFGPVWLSAAGCAASAVVLVVAARLGGRVLAGRIAAAITVATAVLLLVAADVHGAALAAGLVIAVVAAVVPAGTRSGRPGVAPAARHRVRHQDGTTQS